MRNSDDITATQIITGLAIGIFLILGIVAGGMYGCARYSVWQQTLKEIP